MGHRTVIVEFKLKLMNEIILIHTYYVCVLYMHMDSIINCFAHI